MTPASVSVPATNSSKAHNLLDWQLGQRGTGQKGAWRALEVDEVGGTAEPSRLWRPHSIGTHPQVRGQAGWGSEIEGFYLHRGNAAKAEIVQLKRQALAGV